MIVLKVFTSGSQTNYSPRKLKHHIQQYFMQHYKLLSIAVFFSLVLFLFLQQIFLMNILHGILQIQGSIFRPHRKVLTFVLLSNISKY
jgi:hypothetical protein